MRVERREGRATGRGAGLELGTATTHRKRACAFERSKHRSTRPAPVDFTLARRKRGARLSKVPSSPTRLRRSPPPAAAPAPKVNV
eukprot:3307312-Pleurochrysis_carterae.AAC.1